MKYLYILLVAAFCAGTAFTQQINYSDSAAVYYEKGQYTKAMPFAIKAFETVKGLDNADTAYIDAAYTLACCYKNRVNDSALTYFIIAADGAKRQYGEVSLKYGWYLADVATSYMELGNYKEAESGFQGATAVLEKIDVPYKNAYAFCLIQHAALYSILDNLGKAEELLVKASSIAPKEPVEQKTEYALALHNLASLYEKMGDYLKQETTCLKVLEVVKEVLGEGHPAYGSALNNLAMVYWRRQDFQQADSVLKKALELKKLANGNVSITYIMTLNNLGVINKEMGKYDVAEKYLTENVEIAYNNGGEKILQYPFCINSLASLYATTGRKGQADSLYQKSLAIYNKLGLRLNSNRLRQLYDMSGKLYADDSAKAAKCLQEAIAIENQLLLDKLDFLSEKELLVYLKGIDVSVASPYIFLQHYKAPEILSAAYNSKLLYGGVGLQNSQLLYQNIAQSTDTALTSLWKNYLQLKSSFTKILSTPVAQRNTNTDSIGLVLNQQEKDLLRRSADYRDIKKKLSITWQDVRNHLQNNEAAIEFVRFNYKLTRYINIKADTVYYAAMLVRPQDTVPTFITLFEEKELIAALKGFSYKGAVNSRGGKTAANIPQRFNNDIYKLVWRPLEPYLTQTKRIYFSPDGLLHRLAFTVIPYKRDSLLCDKYNLVQLTSTRHIALQEGAISTSMPSIALFGGINYNLQSIDTSFKTSASFNVYAIQQNRGIGVDTFLYLPHTLKEVRTIQTSAAGLKKQVTVFIAGNATESAFRNLGGINSPTVVHFATHGFTLPDTTNKKNDTDVPFKTSDNPLLRCGLIMAGGNKGWKGMAGENEDDGILTGLEISSVQLPNTQLAVLSACETGLGKIEGSEGVFGLQRAFKLAGVNYVMASLWQVPDKETSEFMETFYNLWLGGTSIRQAFYNTQQTMRQKYSPYYWAAFTLVQ